MSYWGGFVFSFMAVQLFLVVFGVWRNLIRNQTTKAIWGSIGAACAGAIFAAFVSSVIDAIGRGQ